MEYSMYLADYHMHSKYSFDSSADMDDICQMAIRRGLSEIAITDHIDIYTGLPYGELLDFDIPGGQQIHMDVQGLYQELQTVRARYEGHLKVKIGAELGQPQVNPEAAKAFLQDYGAVLDFVLGSIHNMENDLDVYYYNFDEIDVPKMYDRYVDWMITLAETGDFDVMGHLTYPLRYLFERKQMRLDVSVYEEKFRYLFKVLAEKGRGIELNVSGMYKDMQDTMPSIELLRLYKACGGEMITVGSDAHKPEYVGYYQKEAQELLRTVGLKYLTVFTKRKPEFIKL